ncbi:hypothetical protein D3260_12370 [Salinisphaera sp. Q1T1-3]|nr:hypothetical protein D3260_12370 [Salinisphaera sp. Q1T1-3]
MALAAAGFLLPPVLGLVLVDRLFGGLGTGLWFAGGGMAVFALSLSLILWRATGPAPSHRGQS